MEIFGVFIKRREPEYPLASPPSTRETGPEPVAEPVGIPEPVRTSDFDGVNLRRVSQLFTTFSSWAGFGLSAGDEAFSGRAYQPDPNAAYPYGELGVDAPRTVVARPPNRVTG